MKNGDEEVLSGVVIIPTQPVHPPFRAENTVRVLSALVPASVSGLVGDVSLVAGAGEDEAARIADHAGCRLFRAAEGEPALRAAVSGARHDMILLLGAGTAPLPGFQAELDGLLAAGIRACRMLAEPSGLVQRLFPGFCPVAAVIAPRSDILAVAGELDPASGPGGLARALRIGRTLQSRAIVLP